ncbi:hypothetical protein RHSIM_Rhsim11G0047900 [Rhododendron simsii]|uniref:Protein ENHANCED DISEASE RESISTANCE 2 C-terminal domain-containing protein n=1 Tax=Rhododendron simsii TaxID=118357 RepID=A0A834G6N9_RHOSS|nr:hypothetical protein RHSIM_Rhsim11G0047900 [Rhododendron simsii]
MKPSQQSHSSLCVDLTVCDGAGGCTVGDGGGVDDEGVDRSGLWVAKGAVGNYSACLLCKAPTCQYYRGPVARGENYLDIDVDIGNSVIANAVLNGADGGHETEEELSERLFGAVRVCLVEMSTAMVADRVVRRG